MGGAARCRALAGAFVALAGTILSAQTGSEGRVLVKKEERLLSYGHDGIAIVKTILHGRPPFYRGAVPFSYLAGIRHCGVEYGLRSVAWEQFATFRVTFQLDPNFAATIPGIARAVGRNGELLAEAHAIRILRGTGFEVGETHFDKRGNPIFECRSLFDFEGWKIDEIKVRGQKG